MKWIIRIGVIMFAVFCGIKAVPEEKASSGDITSTSIRYVSLGDSIAYGYGLSDRKEQSYVELIRKNLETKYDSVFVTNFGENGMQSGELLDILTNPERKEYKKYRATIKHADFVTISIGSNDLLHLIQLDLNMEEMIKRDAHKFDEACVQFAKTFPKIIREIRAVNPDVKIYADNIYNPAKGIDAFSQVYSVADVYINRMNRGFYPSDEYVLVDIKKCFDGEKESMVNLSFKGREIDPHPSEKGHKKIAQMVIKAMER